MYSLEQYLIAFFLSLIVAVFTTPLVKKLAIKIGATDNPNFRKVHQKVMPRLGGLSIILGFIAGFIYLSPKSDLMLPIMLGGTIIILVGIIDDKYTLTAKYKLTGQIAAALIVIAAGIKIDYINIPFYGNFDFGIFSYIITILWIVGITNAINLIDGLDGLASGVSTIAMSAILLMAIFDGQVLVITLSVILIGSTLGFLFFNFYPAKIFMGDTGALFLGYAISIISILGLFKSVTIFSLIIPIIILAVPIFDTLFAIIRRILNKQKISAPDKSHLHHCLLSMGFNHRNTVLIIYLISIFFGISAIIFSASTLWGSFFILGLLILIIQLTAEIIGLIGEKRKPLINTLKKVFEPKV
jgi:UDP-GlcNAc:undecaprenyl-phosphate GlcNAc-1-phosphate transferase